MGLLINFCYVAPQENYSLPVCFTASAEELEIWGWRSLFLFPHLYFSSQTLNVKNID
ncbi:hypothetical protein [Nostoc sp.]